MKRKVLGKSGTRQRAVLLPLETFLALTETPALQRHHCGGGRAKEDVKPRRLDPLMLAAAHQPR
ncbi:hypothetical protein D3C71_1410730 [compost metagenome]